MDRHAETNDTVVSFDDEPLILVDPDDNILGYEAKNICHDGEGLLHRAFSIFVFDTAGRLLLQRRAEGKRLWPGYWSNSCCSHPRRGEEDPAAADRRVHEELGIAPALHFLFRFRYHARYRDLGAEHELCSIYAAVSDDPVAYNVNEIADTDWIEPAALDAALAERPEDFTPWLRLEWPRIRQDHWFTVETLLGKD
ncbi:isopentenyl-diphosphate delta-isomerase [Salinisphaera sp. PC39]|uniref:isopentenyl-diphosphate Delta-isomerase n=1 Tax=Salinisphaera sp. PC39 TaxID=1304156 RepID=UPI00333F3207